MSRVKKHILFVDDEPRVLQGIQRMLHAQREEWVLHFAHGVDVASDMISKATFDAVVSDISMPGKDGFELLRILHEADTTKDIPVIILTGNKEHSLKRRALEMGATDLLNKPVTREDLLARLRSVLRLKSYQDDLKANNDLLEQEVRERTTELEESRLDIVLRLGRAAEYRDEETGNHILRVGCYCRVLAEELGMTGDFIEMIFLTSPLHDIGKIGIPDNILLKSGKLTSEERLIMQQHCAIGAQLLSEELNSVHLVLGGRQAVPQERRPAGKDNPLLQMASTIALTHHEKWDGSGYPNGLAGQEIPLVARIAAFADVYDALRSVRSYKPAYSEEETLTIMKQECGKHLDPLAFAAFEKTTEDFSLINDHYSDKIRSARSGEKHVQTEETLVC